MIKYQEFIFGYDITLSGLSDLDEATSGDASDEVKSETASDGGKTSISYRDIGIGALLGAGITLVIVAIVTAILRKKKKPSQPIQENMNVPEDIVHTIKVEEEQVNYGMVQENLFAPGTGRCDVGTLHNIGKRGGQQDCLGTTETKSGTFAIVADGMGGLADGDKVSQKIVFSMLQDASALPANGNETKLYEMVAHANREVNKMLGPSGLYKSGSTLIAVLAEEGKFHWISVGDSRIYLYRGGELLQINPEHVFEVELAQQAINGDISFGEAAKHPKRKGLTSFIGMGELKYVSGSRRGIATEKGDRILLMSDGVFNTLSESEICNIIKQYDDVKQAAEVLEQEVMKRDNPKQDNFTAIVMKL